MSEDLEFHSIDEIRYYIKKEVERQVALNEKKIERWRVAKKGIWLLLLVVAFLQYYLINVIYQTITLPTLEVSVPVPKPPPKTQT
ncbi:MAG: hypothetical protein HY661_09685 [Betaproteobacteria bacterium]|nr:hypothetical protein [Betaproteobacteria bacterium]